jgi:hypothetical protein
MTSRRPRLAAWCVGCRARTCWYCALAWSGIPIFKYSREAREDEPSVLPEHPDVLAQVGVLHDLRTIHSILDQKKLSGTTTTSLGSSGTSLFLPPALDDFIQVDDEGVLSTVAMGSRMVVLPAVPGDTGASDLGKRTTTTTCRSAVLLGPPAWESTSSSLTRPGR